MAEKYLSAKNGIHEYFEINYLNYKKHINGWAGYLAGYLSALDDKCVIFALDDYLLAGACDLKEYQLAEEAIMNSSGKVVCVKLCHSTPQEHLEYPVTTQYCIWDRQFLIELLENQNINTPWEFEINGSKIFDNLPRISTHRPCLPYFCNSSLSKQWQGVRLDGLNEEDTKYLKEHYL